MPKANFQIDRTNLQDLPDRVEKILGEWQTSAREKVDAYFKRIDGEIISVTGPITLKLEKFLCIVRGRTFDREVRASLSANVNGEQKSEPVRCVRNYDPRRRGAKLSGESGNVWVETLRDVVSGDRATAALTPEVFANDPFFSLLNVTILEKLDAVLGRDTASVVTRWRIAQVLVWLLTLIAAVIIFLKNPNETTGLRVGISVIGAFVTNLVAHGMAACCMPASFFENYGAGQRFMRLAGTTAGNETQVLFRTITALVIFALVLVTWVTYRTFH